MGVDGQNLSMLADLRTADERENEEDFDPRRSCSDFEDDADGVWFDEDEAEVGGEVMGV